jgi:Fe-S oxidoreductase
MGFGLGLMRGRVEYAPEVADVVYDCQLCGACDVSCKYAMDMNVLEPLYAVREECAKRNLVPPVLKGMVQRMAKNGPMWAEPGTRRQHWAQGLDVKDYTKENVPVVYHAGCLANHDAGAARQARASVSLLLAASIDVGIAADREPCCGGRAYEWGYPDEALERAQGNAAAIERSGAEYVVTACAHCYHSFRVLYAKFGLLSNVKVLHVTEYLAELLEQGKLSPRKELDITVTYHDPCHLGRLSEPWIAWEGVQREKHMRVYDPPRVFRRGGGGVYEAPRSLIKAIPGIKLVEMDRTQEYAWCCGAGGGVRENNPEFAAWTAARRLKEAVSTGADALVTACPHCYENLQQNHEGGQAFRIFDIVELLQQAI